MERNPRFFSSSDAIRVTWPLDDGWFVVVKIFNDGPKSTVKYWKGTLEDTMKHWNMEEFHPDDYDWLYLSNDAINLFKESIDVALASILYQL